jgi:hypothetical protein
VVRPDAGEAVGLELHAHLQQVRVTLAGALLRLLHLFRNAQLMLHVMTDFVRNDIGLGKIARCSEARLQVAVETEIEIDPLVARTVERPHGGLTGAAGGLRVPPV